MSGQEAVVREAWWGGGRATGARPDIVHVVAWPAGRDEGYAVCGKHLKHRRTFALGSARQARVPVCTPCLRRLGDMAPSAPVVPIQNRTNRKRVRS